MLEQVRLRDGTEGWVTDLRRDDREQLATGFAELSDEAKRQRFLAPVERLSEAMLRQLVDDVDGIDHVALVLTAETSPDVFDPVAIGRIVRYDAAPETADVAVTVKDSWQGRGVATSLLAVLVAHRPAGVVRLVTEVQSDNSASLAMLKRLGPVEVEPNGHGAFDVVVDLGPEPVSPTPPASVPLVRPEAAEESERDRERRRALQTRDLVCPWLT